MHCVLRERGDGEGRKSRRRNAASWPLAEKDVKSSIKQEPPERREHALESERERPRSRPRKATSAVSSRLAAPDPICASAPPGGAGSASDRGGGLSGRVRSGPASWRAAGPGAAGWGTGARAHTSPAASGGPEAGSDITRLFSAPAHGGAGAGAAKWRRGSAGFPSPPPPFRVPRGSLDSNVFQGEGFLVSTFSPPPAEGVGAVAAPRALLLCATDERV